MRSKALERYIPALSAKINMEKRPSTHPQNYKRLRFYNFHFSNLVVENVFLPWLWKEYQVIYTLPHDYQVIFPMRTSYRDIWISYRRLARWNFLQKRMRYTSKVHTSVQMGMIPIWQDLSNGYNKSLRHFESVENFSVVDSNCSLQKILGRKCLNEYSSVAIMVRRPV